MTGAPRGVAKSRLTAIPQSARATGGLDIRLKVVDPIRLQRVTIDPEQCGGRPCIRGYRIRVTDILELLASGATHEEILTDYPFLEKDDIYAALEYAAHQSDHPVLRAS